MTGTTESILSRLEAERGYLLSYHVVFAHTNPEVLERYGDLYRALTLTRHVLDPVRCELIWVGLLAAVREHVGTIHIERARAEGAGENQLRAAIRVAAVSDSWETLAYASTPWDLATTRAVADDYLSLLESVANPLDRRLGWLIALVVQGARRDEAPFLHLLEGLVAQGATDEEIGESVGYLLQPCGANTLLWATDTWFSALRNGRLPESRLFGRAPHATRMT